jgi:hypothetical protein
MMAPHGFEQCNQAQRAEDKTKHSGVLCVVRRSTALRPRTEHGSSM